MQILKQSDLSLISGGAAQIYAGQVYVTPWSRSVYEHGVYKHLDVTSGQISIGYYSMNVVHTVTYPGDERYEYFYTDLFPGKEFEVYVDQAPF